MEAKLVCPSCGAEVFEDFTYCDMCGKKLPWVAKGDVEETIVVLPSKGPVVDVLLGRILH